MIKAMLLVGVHLVVLAAAAITYPIVDTDQTLFYSNTALLSSAPAAGADFYGQDAHYCGNKPSYSWVDTAKTMVQDGVTGLIWTASYGNRTNFDGAQVAAAASRIGGHSDWRVPTNKEMFSLWLGSGTDPSGDSSSLCFAYIDIGYFQFEYGTSPFRSIDVQAATTTKYVNQNEQMPKWFGVNVADGRIKGYPFTPQNNNGNQFVNYYVRGATTYGVNSFTDNGDQTITDSATGLMWAKKDSGNGEVASSSLSGTGAVSWKAALAACEALTLAGHSDWRLPNIKELHSIIDYTRSPGTNSSAAIDPMFTMSSFTNENGIADYGYYWSSTSMVSCQNNMSTEAWYVGFGRGLGKMNNVGMDVHGAGCMRSDPKAQQAGTTYPYNYGPQGDVIRGLNYYRCVRGGTAVTGTVCSSLGNPSKPLSSSSTTTTTTTSGATTPPPTATGGQTGPGPCLSGQPPTCADGTSPTCPDGSRPSATSPPCTTGQPTCTNGAAPVCSSSTATTAPPVTTGSSSSLSVGIIPVLIMVLILALA